MSWFLSLGRVPLMVTSRGGSAALCVHLIHPRPHFFYPPLFPILAIVTGLVLLYLAGQLFFFCCRFSSDHSCFSSGCFLFALSSPTGLINPLSRSRPRSEPGIDITYKTCPSILLFGKVRFGWNKPKASSIDFACDAASNSSGTTTSSSAELYSIEIPSPSNEAPLCFCEPGFAPSWYPL